MTTVVRTISTCDRCQLVQSQAGDISQLPSYWAKVRVDPVQPAGVVQGFEKELCRNCYFALSDWLRTAPTEVKE